MTDQDFNFAARSSDAEEDVGLMPPHTYVVCASPEPTELGILQDAGTEVHFLPTAQHLVNVQHPAGCVLLDLDHRPACVADVEHMLATAALWMPLIVATAHGTAAIAVKWMKAGAADFIEKPYERASLIHALKQSWQRGYQTSNRLSPMRELTIRQRAVLHLVAKGLHSREIADQMRLSVRTVEMHRAHLMKSLGVRTTVEAILLWHNSEGRHD